MRCKPGDLAIIIEAPPELQESLGGLVETAVALYTHPALAAPQEK